MDGVSSLSQDSYWTPGRVKEVPEFPLCTERQTVPVMATDLGATEREGSFLRPEPKERGQLDQAPVSMVWF